MEGKDFSQNTNEEFNKVLKLVQNLSPVSRLGLRDYLNSEHLIQEITISEEQKSIVRDRIAKYEQSPGSYLSWDEIETRLKPGK